MTIGIERLGLDESLYRNCYKKTAVQKRGKSPESTSDSINMVRRATMDKLGRLENGNRYSMSEAYKVGRQLFDDNCYLCGYELGEVGIQADHVISHIHGGYGAAGNMLPAHAECNDIKKDSLYEDTIFYNPKTAKKLEQFRKAYEFKPLPTDTWTLVDSMTRERIEGLAVDIMTIHREEKAAPFDVNLLDLDFWKKFFIKKCPIEKRELLLIIASIVSESELSILNTPPKQFKETLLDELSDELSSLTINQMLESILKYRKSYKDYYKQ